mmetsp:Transcript_124246/g.362710  ORF Transcript_124246/g.362710 Transcript_124246/m.362710 type:complete len:314 (-) Transcript_124246:412-1353(-)
MALGCRLPVNPRSKRPSAASTPCPPNFGRPGRASERTVEGAEVREVVGEGGVGGDDMGPAARRGDDEELAVAPGRAELRGHVVEGLLHGLRHAALLPLRGPLREDVPGLPGADGHDGGTGSRKERAVRPSGDRGVDHGVEVGEGALATDGLVEAVPRRETQAVQVSPVQRVDEQRRALDVGHRVLPRDHGLQHAPHLLGLVLAVLQARLLARHVGHEPEAGGVRDAPGHHCRGHAHVQVLLDLNAELDASVDCGRHVVWVALHVRGQVQQLLGIQALLQGRGGAAARPVLADLQLLPCQHKARYEPSNNCRRG